MKRPLYFLLLFFILSISSALAQTVTLTFTAKDVGNHYVQLNRVAITNLTKSWQETIYWPDTTLTMQNGTGIEEHVTNGGFALSQNNPNPFYGTTDVSLTVANEGLVTLEISDVNGKILKTHNVHPQQGTHQFRVSLSTPGTYVMSARQKEKSSSIKMVCNGGGTLNSIDYLGMVHTITYVLKSSTTNPFNFGDMMEYVGYATINGTEMESQRITQAQGASQTFVLQFDVLQNHLPALITQVVNNITSSSATAGGIVTTDGGAAVFDRGICYSTIATPTVSDNCVHIGQGTGSFSDNLTGLSPNTTYYVRAYAMNSVGTAYGNEVSFTTTTASQLPTVITTAVNNVAQTIATCGGNVTSDGGATVTARGVCWSTSQNPTTADSHTSDGSGTGSFTSSLTGLTASTTYYVRAYATNSAGTTYGNEVSFTTADDVMQDGQPCPDAPTVTDIDNNTYNTVQIGQQCWMKENLRTTHYSNGTSITLGSSTSTSTAYRYYPDNISSNVATYGYLYNWAAVMNGATSSSANPSGVQGICPNGWHVPSDAEWTQLVDYVSGRSEFRCNAHPDYIAKALASTTGWNSSSGQCFPGNQSVTSNNATGFGAMPAGGYAGDYGYIGMDATFWSSSQSYVTTAYSRSLYHNDANIYRDDNYDQYYGFSVRCLRNENGTSTIQLPTVTTSAISNITANTATCGGNVTSDGGATVTARGVCWSTSQNPTTDDNNTSDGIGTGCFTSNLMWLIEGTTYYVRAYATNSAGTAYGNEVSFTSDATPNLPTVITSAVSNIFENGAIGGGFVTSDGGATVTARGVCWSTDHQNTMAMSTSLTYGYTTNGGGIGDFSSNLTALLPNTTYYVRAYATNSQGTKFGDEISFTTINAQDGQPCPSAHTLTDYNGNIYNTVQIGPFCWMKENLRTTRYADGTSIDLGSSTSASTAYRYYPDNNSSNVATYGYLYNWKAVMRDASSSDSIPSGVQGICPTGWHVPSKYEWFMLNAYLSTRSEFLCNNDSQATAKSLASKTGWNSNTTPSCTPGYDSHLNNTTQFSAFPVGPYFAGYDNAGYYHGFGESASFWSSTECVGTYLPSAQYMRLNYSDYSPSYPDDKTTSARSVRCLRDFNSSSTAQLPTVTTSAASNINANSATCGGNVTSDGGATVTVRGVCWSTSQNPTTADSHTSDGSGTGSFSSNLTGLTASTTYYVRAYATNSAGTTYGNEVSFTTTASAQEPSVTTAAVSNVTETSATCGGNVTSDGGATVTVRGVCWSTSQNPTTADSHTSDGSGTGSFASNLTGLTANTTYYVRAYATNSAGTTYGNEVSFITADDVMQDGQPCPDAPTVTDIDNNTYNTVQIGQQCWMKENLRTTRYANGTSIALGSSSSTTTAYRYYPDNNSSNVVTYGYLYNWKAVMGNSPSSSANPSGVQGICPTGWHVPSDTEWVQLTTYVSSQSQYVCGNDNTQIAKALASTTGWNSSSGICDVGNTPSNNNATNFNAPPAGVRTYSFFDMGRSVNFWKSTEYNSNNAYSIGIALNVANIVNSNNPKTYGFSVRCVRDESGSTTTQMPTVTTSAASNITANSVTCGGNVTSDGGATVTARGVCWSTSQSPTVNDSHTTDGSGTGSFTSNLTGLTANTTYYVRAYATNSVGTTYGNEVSFTTLSSGGTSQDGQPCPGMPTLTDIDGNMYNTVQIGNQCWMKENLRTTKLPNGTAITFAEESCSNSTKYRYYPNNDTNNVATYGYLYNWAAVMNGASSSTANPSGVQGVCPDGWHVPSNAEWTQLTTYVSSQSQYVCGSDTTYIAKALASTTGWDICFSACTIGNNPNANNATGFSALPAGMNYGSFFQCYYGDLGTTSDIWSSTEYGSFSAYRVHFSEGYAYVIRNGFYKDSGLSVRCVRNECDSSTAQLPTVTTSAASNITANSATCGGNVTSDGGATVTARGVCWSTSHNPTVSQSHTTNGGGTGGFTSGLTGLTAGTTYYVRAYATNSVGTAYGNEVSFTTLPNGGTLQDGQPCPGAATLTDIDGNVYNTVQIGNQCWMKENLRTTRYADGTSIALGSSTSASACRYYPNNNSSNVVFYGYLYNWPAVMHNSTSSNLVPSGVQGICPIGWHMPSLNEWLSLNTHVQNQSLSPVTVLSSEEGWEVGCSPKNNATGFSALPAGWRGNGGYYGMTSFTAFWSSTTEPPEYFTSPLPWYFGIGCSVSDFHTASAANACSVRCVKDQ